jgi:DNA-binding XRE family transcriptional regulator
MASTLSHMNGTLRDLIEFSRTEDFRHGVFENLFVSGLEVLLLTITIPLILYLSRRIRTRPIRFAVDFYLFQIFHKITRMFLDLASAKDTLPIPTVEEKWDPKMEVYSHFVYGNLENKLFVLKKVMADSNAYVKQIESRTLDDFLRYQTVCDRCLDEIDRLTAMLVALPRVQKELFSMRMLIYPLRDLMGEVANDIKVADKEPFRRRFHTYDVQRVTQQVRDIIALIFAKRRNLIDSMIRHKQWLSYARLLLSLPYVLVRRWIQIKVCRFLKKPYRDFISPSPVPEMIHDWRSKHGLTQEQAATLLDLSLNDYYDYEQGYRLPEEMAVIERIKQHVRASEPKPVHMAATEQSPPPYGSNR